MSTIKVADVVVSPQTFYVDAVLFDMDGTMVDSITAVEKAWGGVAVELHKDPDEVIAATHGRRAIDNLRDLKPELVKTPDEAMDPHVTEFETRILNEADAFSKEVRSRRESVASSRNASRRASRAGSQSGTPREGSTPGSRTGSKPGSRSNSLGPSRQNSISRGRPARGSFANELSKRMLGMQITQLSMSSAEPKKTESIDSGIGLVDTPSPKADSDEDVFFDDDEEEIDIDAIEVDTSDLTDASVKILPGVRHMLDSIPHGKWCVATSGATTYCHGALARVGIELPPVVITADHKELKRGKPFPDPFILAATKMGHDVKRCLVVEDSPSGIKAGVASGATVIAVCTSHPSEKIKHCGQTYLVPNLEHVDVIPQDDGRLMIVVNPAPRERSPAANLVAL